MDNIIMHARIYDDQKMKEYANMVETWVFCISIVYKLHEVAQ